MSRTAHRRCLVRRSRALVRMASIILALPLAVGCGDARPNVLAIGTGGTGGVYYLLGGSIAEQWSRGLPEHSVVAEVTGGSVENLSLLMRGDVQVAFTMATNAHQAYYASGPFARGEAGQVRALASLYPNVLHVVTLDGGGIATLDDLRGRRVSVGAPGSGTEIAARTLLEANGIGADEIRAQRLNFNETASGLRDGTLDVGFWSVGPPTSSIMDLASARSLRFLPIEGTAFENAVRADPTQRRDTLRAGTYTGLDADIVTLNTPNILVVHADLPEPLAYELARLLFEGQPELAAVHPAAARLTPTYTLETSPIPLHPGVIRYLRDAGHSVDGDSAARD